MITVYNGQVIFCPGQMFQKMHQKKEIFNHMNKSRHKHTDTVQVWSYLVGVSEYSGGGGRVHPLGSYWYKEGDHTDTRDWLPATFYIKYSI